MNVLNDKNRSLPLPQLQHPFPLPKLNPHTQTIYLFGTRKTTSKLSHPKPPASPYEEIPPSHRPKHLLRILQVHPC